MDREMGGPTAREANAEMFGFVDRLIALFEEHHETAVDPDDAAHIVLWKIVERAHNAAKAVIVLCEHRWWEFADGLVRQLYELLLDVEELRQSEDREAAAKRWLRFGALQYMLGLAAQRKYDADTGRMPPDAAEKIATFRAGLPSLFPEFVRYSRTGKVSLSEDGDVNFVGSWHRKSVREQARNSEDDIRLHQYELLYRSASDQVHGTPGALIHGLRVDVVEGGNGPSIGIQPWLSPDEMVDNDTFAIRQTLSMTFAFFATILALTDELHGVGQRVPALLTEVVEHMHGANATDEVGH